MSDYELGTTTRCDAVFRDLSGDLYDPTTVSAVVTRPSGAVDIISTVVKSSVGNYYFNYTSTEEGEHRYTFTGTTASLSAVVSGFFTVVEYTHTDLDYLIPALRLHLGDLDSTNYRYAKETLRNALVAGLNALGRRWNHRYMANSAGTVTRSTTIVFRSSAPPTIMYSDERPILLMSSMILKSAELQGNLWDLASWRDDEIAYSNLGAGRTAEASITRDREELEQLLRSKLYSATRESLPGYRLPLNIREGYK